MERQFIRGIEDALTIGYEQLQCGVGAVDAVCAAVRVLEDNQCFNSAHGAALRCNGEIRLDASLMDGNRLRCGSVAGASRIKNPIDGARAVMEETEYVMLVGSDADQFAMEVGIEAADQSYFESPYRLAQYDHIGSDCGTVNAKFSDDFFSTVGAVALDSTGNLAAATSTGGSAGSRLGRVGDSPLIGAGTYADNRRCAVSTTGHGEFFVRVCAAHEVAARCAAGQDLQSAAEFVVNEELPRIGGSGGLIAIDHFGNVAMPFNTEGMARGVVGDNQERLAEVF